MKKAIFITAITAALLLVSQSRAEVSIIMNGSFESDGATIYDIRDKVPFRWAEVNLPEDQYGDIFGGSVWSDWSTHGSYYLAIDSFEYGIFQAGDMATISQQVYLDDANQIIFDIRLDTDYDEPWNPLKRSAVVLIDTDVVWESNDTGTDVRGDYFNQIVDVNDVYKDGNSHTLTLGLRVNQSETDPYVYYLAQWDFIKFDKYCGGIGYLPEDLNRDCGVDMDDFRMLTDQWLADDPNYRYDLYEDDGWIVDFRDYAAFADKWLGSSYWEDYLEDNFFEPETLSSADLNDDGIVNFSDYAVLIDNWMSQGPAARGDIYRAGDSLNLVDYEDLGEMAEQWLQRSWLFGLN